MIVLEEVEPFVNWRFRYIVELVNPYQIIFRKELRRLQLLYYFVVTLTHKKLVTRMHTDERGRAVIQVVTALAKVEIKNVYGIYLLYVLVCRTKGYMFGNGLGHTIQHSLKIIPFTCELYFYQDDLALTVFGLYIHTVELVAQSVLVAFALKKFDDGYLLIQQHSDKTFKHRIVGLVPKQSLCCPIKSYDTVTVHFVLLLAAKIYKKSRTAKQFGIFFISMSYTCA